MSHSYFYSYYYSVLFDIPISDHALMLRCLPFPSAYQRTIESHLVLSPGYWQRQSADCWGNPIVACGNRQSHQSMIYESVGIIEQDDCLEIDPSPSRWFFLPTPLTRMPLDVIETDSVERICEFVHNAMNYQKGLTTNYTTASEAMLSGQGVCQDYAHIMIGLCRNNGIPARYVVGMLPGEGETHAWVEVWADGVWTAYDPTHNMRISHGYIKIAHGRDAADCQVCRGTYKGFANEICTARVVVQQL